MRKVVVNSTPIISLAKIKQLQIFKRMYENIIIPQAVYDELTVKNDMVCEQFLAAKEWIHVSHIRHISDRENYSARLHAGEIEVIILAQEIKAELIILDDYAARKTAEGLSIPLTGTVGVLVKAKKLGIVDSVMPLLDDLKSKNIYFAEALMERVRDIVGE